MSELYLDHFGLVQAPFRIAPDPALFQDSRTHRRVLDWMEGGIAARVPVLSLTGDVGTGKTTLLRLLLDRHGSDWTIGLISAFHSRGDEILVQARHALGLPDGDGDSPALSSERIRRFARAVRAKGGFTVLIVDEAQALGIESVSALASLAMDDVDGSALTLLLIGQPELRALLAEPALRDLRIQESARTVLTPFSEGETATYVAHRLARSGACGPVFDAGAMQMLHVFSRGVPRLINIMADYCLRIAAAEDMSRLDADWVRAVLDEATTVGVLSHLGLSGTKPPQPEMQAATAMPQRDIPHPAASNTADNADRVISPSVAASGNVFTPAAARGTPPSTEPREEPAAWQATPIRSSPQGSGVPRAAPEPEVAAAVAASQAHVPDPPVDPSRLLLPRNPRKRRGLSLVSAAAVVVLAAGAAILWLQPGTTPPPIAPDAAPARADVNPAGGALAAGPAPPQAQPAILEPVPVTPDPAAASLMTQALESEDRDPATAAVAYARAALRGRARAAWYLGQFHETGTGGPPNPGYARLWYAAASDLPAARRRLQAMGPPAVASAVVPTTPVPVFQARLDTGASEMIWRAPDGPAPVRFRVEAWDRTGKQLPLRETAVPGLILRAPVSAWRVTAIGADGAESAPSAMVRMIPEE